MKSELYERVLVNLSELAVTEEYDTLVLAIEHSRQLVKLQETLIEYEEVAYEIGRVHPRARDKYHDVLAVLNELKVHDE